MMKRLFAPGADSFLTSVGLVALRLILAGTMVLNHGLGKLKGFGSLSSEFPDPLGVGNSVSLMLAIFAEVFCAILLAAGLLTRFAAFSLAVTMSVAFFLVHKAALTGPQSGELALVYLAGFLALLFSGGGSFSIDSRIFGKKKA